MVCIMAKTASPRETKQFKKKKTSGSPVSKAKTQQDRMSSKVLKAKLIKNEFSALKKLLPAPESSSAPFPSSSSSSSPLEVVLKAIEYIQQLENKLGGAAVAQKKFLLQAPVPVLGNVGLLLPEAVRN